MKRALAIISIGAALTGCAAAPSNGPKPAERITMGKDWIGKPGADAQMEQCVAWTRPASDYKPYLDHQRVVVDGKVHTVTTDTRSQMERNISVSGRARAVNACMAEAGYTYSEWVERFSDAYYACVPKHGIGSQRAKECMDAYMESSTLIDTAKLP